jgi:hypothetical protein
MSNTSRVPGYSNYGGGGPFAPLAAPSPTPQEPPAPATRKRTLKGAKRFTSAMRMALYSVANHNYQTFATDRTIRALERLKTVEHTSMGWRLTALGRQRAKHLGDTWLR